MTLCICGCGHPAVALHHVVYQQEIRRRNGDTSDPRSMVPVAQVCHERHHSHFRSLPLSVLPDEAFDFARDLMGAGAAFNYLGRHYSGADVRLQMLLQEAA
jgi:hypothetical protein